MSSITSWGRSYCFPVRENMALFKGFQNPRTPSYFSNTHLIISLSVKYYDWDDGSQRITNWWDWWKNWWKNKHWWVPQYPQPPWLVCQRIQEEGNHWWEFLLPPSTLCESDLVDVIWCLLLNCVCGVVRNEEMKRYRDDGWDYLSRCLSHQQGTVINVIPFWATRVCFNWSLSLISSNETSEYEVTLR